MDFIYNEVIDMADLKTKKFLLDTKLINAQSKHFAILNDNIKLNELSKKVNYKYSIFGSNHNSNIEEEKNRILNMSKSLCERPLRFVIDSYGRVWSDNKHWCIAYILKYGYDITLADIPTYIVDFRTDIPIIVNINNTLYDSITHLNNAISCGMEIQNRIDAGWRNVEISYTIQDLIKELNF